MLENIFLLLSQNDGLLYVAVGLLSLCIGSFLNVVIHRLPMILKKDWHNDCQLFLHPDNPQLNNEKLTLSFPHSRCPECKTQIKWYQNIPVISWLVLRGKCNSCKHPISFLYPFIELLTCVLSIAVVFKYGVTSQALFGLILTWTLITLVFIDFAEQILPDRIVYPLIGLGLLLSTYGVYIPSDTAIWGAVIGFLSLWVVYILFKLITGKEGMGYGDFKLLAACGAWFGALALPSVIVVSSVLGCVVGIYFLKVKKESKPFAFGPYIAASIWVYFMFGSLVG